MVDIRYMTDYKIKSLKKINKLELLAKHFFFISPELIALNSYNLMYKFYSSFLSNLKAVSSLEFVSNLDSDSYSFICYNSNLLIEKGFKIDKGIIKKLKTKSKNSVLCNKKFFFSGKDLINNNFFDAFVLHYIWPYKIIKDESLINQVMADFEYFLLNNKIIMYREDFLYANDLIRNLLYSWVAFIFLKLNYFAKARFYNEKVDLSKFKVNININLSLHNEERKFIIMVFNYIKSFI